MPLPFLPAWLQDLIMAPLKYLYAIPIAVLDGSYADIIRLSVRAGSRSRYVVDQWFYYDKARLHYNSQGCYESKYQEILATFLAFPQIASDADDGVSWRFFLLDFCVNYVDGF